MPPIQPPVPPIAGETAPGFSTWDATPPHRPGTRDFNGAAMGNSSGADGAAPPPIPGQMPTGGLFNTEDRTIISLGKMVPNFGMSLSAAGAIVQYIAADSTSTSASFVVTVVSAGVYTIAFLNTLFPASLLAPVTALNNVPPRGGYECTVSATVAVGATTTTITVETTHAGVPTDLPFTLLFW